MILITIALASALQVTLYLLLDKIKAGSWKALVFLTVLAGHFFLLPRLFFPKPDPDGINCGMPVLGITLAFWIIGGLLSLCIHITYTLKNNRKL